MKNKFKKFTNREKNEDELNYNLEDNVNENEKVDESRKALDNKVKTPKVKNLRQIGYGAAGLTIGLIAYLLLSAGAPTVNEARSMASEFTTANHDSGFGYEDVVVDEEYTGDVVPLHPFGSYRVTRSEFDEYERNETVRYGKVNPTFFFNKKPVSQEDTEKQEESTRQTPNPTNTSRENNNALTSAKNYINLGTGFSRKGLKDQLEFEEYSESAINYALDNINVDYNEQAYLSAKSYENLKMGFSDKSLIAQLIFEGFSDSQAKYGLDKLNGSSGNGKGGRAVNVIAGFDIHTTKIEEFNVAQIREQFAKHAVLPLDAEHFNVTSTYGIRIDPFTEGRAFHAGVDFSNDGISGSNIYAVMGGEVVESVANFGKDGLGNHVIIDHGDFHTLYAHMKDGPTLEVGDVVQAGDIVGTVGSTGRSTGPHLHFEVGVGGVKFDGLEFLIHAVDKDNSGM